MTLNKVDTAIPWAFELAKKHSAISCRPVRTLTAIIRLKRSAAYFHL